MMRCWSRISFKKYLVLAILWTAATQCVRASSDEVQKFIRCSNETYANRYQLYLGQEDLVMDCMLADSAISSAQQYQYQLQLYDAAGLRPKMEIYNSTNTLSFTFHLNIETSTWRATVPRDNLTINTDIAPVDQWYIEINMFHGFEALNAKAQLLETLKGTLLDETREPILQWTIGVEISPKVITPYKHLITKIQVTQSPCASDVAVMAPVYAPGSPTGVILSVTKSGFTSGGRWFNVTQSLCGLINQLCTSGCQGISIIDLKLTNCYLFLLTNRGLFISQDLLSPATEPLQFSLLFLPILAQMDYSSTTLWFSSQCVTNHLYFAGDYISLISNEGGGNELNSRCVFSGHPFSKWFVCEASAVAQNKNITHRYLSFLHDRYQRTGLLLSHSEVLAQKFLCLRNNLSYTSTCSCDFCGHKEEGAMLSVFNFKANALKNLTKFSPVVMPFEPRGIFLRDNHVIVYGTEVWSSSDRGFSFKKIFSLQDEVVTYVQSCTYNSILFLLTDQGNIYLMKAGLERYAWLNETLISHTFLLCDHMGILMAVHLDSTQPSSLTYRIIPINKLIQEHDVGFDRAIVINYVNPSEVVLHEFGSLDDEMNTAKQKSLFSSDHVGKIFGLSSGGKVVLTDVLPKHYIPGFTGCAVGQVLEPLCAPSMSQEPMQAMNLIYEGTDEMGYLALLRTQSIEGIVHLPFTPDHVGMSAVCPGNNNFLIIRVQNGQAVARVTLPSLMYAGVYTVPSGGWLLFNVSSKASWTLSEGPCRHTLQSLDNLRKNALVRINVRETLTFTFKAYMSDFSLSTTQNKKFMRVVLTNPNVMRVTAKHYWDKANNHMLNLTVHSHLCKKAMTMVTVYIPEASLLCDSPSFTFTLQNACPEGLSIVYLPSQPISKIEWLHGDPVDDMDNKLLFNLPVNYRPPSQLGVFIPISENIYNADPSKPRPRSHYPVSKNSGRYKQCAEKASVEECGCSDSLRVSPLAINSDCRQRVLRKTYPLINFNITLYLRRVNHPDQPLHSPYFVMVTEVNNRTNWAVTGTHSTPTLKKMRQYLKNTLNNTIYNPEGLQISCYGSELFHFRISVIPGVVLCDLMEEVQIYVDEAPLAFPTAYLISCMTAIALGGFVLLGFLFRTCSRPIPSWVKTFLTRSKVSPEMEQD